jgi:hypothetical protein
VATQDLPIVVEPGRTEAIRITLAYGRVPGFFSRKVWLMTDDPQRLVNFRMLGRTDEKNAQQTASAIGQKHNSVLAFEFPESFHPAHRFP